MVFRRYLIACGCVGLLSTGCVDVAVSSTEYTKQVVQENNVAQLIAEVQDTQEAKKLLTQGNNFLDANRYKEALALYNQAVELKKDSEEIWVNRGNALIALHRYEEALESYDKAIAIRPNKNEAWYNRGNALSALRRYQEAVKSYDEAIVINPEKFETWINRGIALTKLKRYTEGLASYNQAITLNSNAHQAYYNKACNYALQNNLLLAVEALDKAIKILPEKYKELAKIDTDFDKIRDQKQFQEVLK
ncbi:tetratricopeptide repeat protein [Okeanomitos corallinicola TIOX110]|uniref:Tetratricopeptide repeat protein n=1 Tax=Okeanomitos corallinicola TIOX110 TaxID=3133117 RepID=A0ABZ2UPU6_9CYAN